MSLLIDQRHRPDSQAVHDFLIEAKVHQITLLTKTRKVLICLNVPYWPDANLYQLVADFLKTLYPGGIEVFWKPHMKGQAALNRLLLDEQQLFKDILVQEHPSLFHWLVDGRWEIYENRITYIAPNILALNQLKRLNASGHFAKLFEILCEEHPQIDFKYDSDDIPKPEPLNLLKKDSLSNESFSGPNSPENGPSCRAPIVHGNKSFSRQNVIYGRIINSIAGHIAECVEEGNRVCFEGTIFNLECKNLKDKRSIVLFCLTDLTDSIECKLFCKTEMVPEIIKQLKSAPAIKVSGKTRIDQYSQELVLYINHINVVNLACRLDHAEKKRVELHLHTQMSNMDGVSSLEELIKLASELGHTHVAVTDHGVVQAFPDAYQLAQKYKINIIYGMEAYIYDDSIPENQRPKTYHCILLAKNKTGLMNLYRLTTESHLRYFKRRPRIPKRLIEYAREGLIIGSACEAGELMQHLVNHPEDHDGLIKLAAFYDYVEIQPLDNNAFMIRKGLAADKEELILYNKKLWQLGKDLGKPVVATCDVHFANQEDAIFRSILMASKGFSDSEQQAPLYYRTTDEMLEEFSYLGAEEAYRVVVEAPNEIAAQTENLRPVPADLFPPTIEGAEKKIQKMTYQKAYELYGSELPDIIEQRLQKELDAIIGNGFAVLYLIAHDLVEKSNRDGYVVGSRGSVGSSLVAYFTGITEVNALPPHYLCPNCCYCEFPEEGSFGTGVDMPDSICPKCGSILKKEGFNIPFEIFMGFKGDKVPDIDLNFSGEYQPRAHSYTEELFGKDNVFRAGTIATVAEKTAFGYVSKYFEERGVVQRKAEIERLRNGCTGVKRTTGQHPGGLMVIPKGIDVHDFTPLQRPADDVKTETVTTHFDYHSINERLVKLDILGHDDPTVVKMLEDLTGINIQDVPLDDPKTMSLFSSTEAIGIEASKLKSSVATYGIPEFNTKFTREMLEDIKPHTFSALLRISGFSHGTDVWLNNAQNLIKEKTATVTETISTRDDILIFLLQYDLNYSDAFKIMEGVRKGRGVSTEFVDLMKVHKVPEWYIESCQKIKYLFPKAHAVAYVTMAYRIAWFKINHPLAFYASYFSVRGIEDFDLNAVLSGETEVARQISSIHEKDKATAKEKAKVSVLEVSLELLLRGYHLENVDLNDSDSVKFKIRNGRLLPPLLAIEGMGTTTANAIVEARVNKPFISIEDLKNRGKVSDTVIKEMKKMNIISHLPESNQILLF